MGHHAAGPREAVEGAAAASERGDEKIRVRVVRHATRARPAAGDPYEHAQPEGRVPAPSPAPVSAARQRRPDDTGRRSTLTLAGNLFASKTTTFPRGPRIF